MADGRREMINRGNSLGSSGRSNSGRPIPRRGQVKAAIAVGVANSLASLFSSKRVTRYLHHHRLVQRKSPLKRQDPAAVLALLDLKSFFADDNVIAVGDMASITNKLEQIHEINVINKEMADGRREMINRGNSLGSSGRSNSGRPIPRRGQVKTAIAVGVANSLASLFSSKSMERTSSQLSR
ncbi:hypothetical protein Vadar_033312 [Vaccinium darrowii]|uniref:Uncharacterized protein n=1 Tax=Vaccinium darrowii TaxID=229202 RepID=A0ACB7Z0W9_9ERIC|nr:hypothetical protein Vadar_033312 [Vaccinium darrowii]